MHSLIDNDPQQAYRRELREQINAAKAKLPLPDLMELLDDGDHAHVSACCPFHDDARPSFSIFQTENGHWRWNCFAGCGGGDEIAYLALREDLEIGEAIQEFLRMAEEHSKNDEDMHQKENDNGSDYD